jgi:VWFA-related protein
VRQRIIGFAAMSPESRPRYSAIAEDAALRRPVASVGSTDAQSVVALVFHQVSHQSRAAAVKAARSIVAALPPEEYAGIFLVDLRATTLAPFTRNTRELEAALDQALTRPPVSTGVSERGIAEAEGPAGAYLSMDSARAAEMRKRLQTGLEGPQHAGAQAASLNDLVALLAGFTGRKTMILFSEGLAVSPRLETVVDRARAENVTVYAINTRGLEAGGSMSLTGQDMDRRELTGTILGSGLDQSVEAAVTVTGRS